MCKSRTHIIRLSKCRNPTKGKTELASLSRKLAPCESCRFQPFSLVFKWVNKRPRPLTAGSGACDPPPPSPLKIEFANLSPPPPPTQVALIHFRRGGVYPILPPLKIESANLPPPPPLPLRVAPIDLRRGGDVYPTLQPESPLHNQNPRFATREPFQNADIRRPSCLTGLYT